MLYIVFNILHECGMSNISIFSGDILFLDYIVVTSGTSVKHIKNTSFKLIKYFKTQSENFVSTSGINSDWVVVDTGSILVHLMLLRSRNFYDLDSLYEDKCKKVLFF